MSDLQLVRVLPALEDEVNCAAWNPQPGGGLVYGTKEGKLRLIRHDRWGKCGGGVLSVLDAVQCTVQDRS